jgi:hypothetical protein
MRSLMPTSVSRSLLALLALLGACSSNEVRSLVEVDVSPGPGVVVDSVDVTVMPAAGAAVVRTFPWSQAQNNVLKVGIYVPAGVTGHADVSASGSSNGTAVARAAAVGIDLAEGGTVAAQLVLSLTTPGGDHDAGPDALGPDVEPGTGDDASSDAADAGAGDDAADAPPPPVDMAYDTAADLPPDLAPDRGPDLAPDMPPDTAPPDPPSLVKCTEYKHGANECVLETRAGDWSLYSVVFSPDGKFLVTGGDDGRVKVWKVTETGLEPDGRVFLSYGRNHLAFTRDGSLLAIGNQRGDLVIMDFARGTPSTLVGHTDEIEGVAFSPDGKFLVSTADDKTLRLWNVAGKLEVKKVDLPEVPRSLDVAQAGAAGSLWTAVGFEHAFGEAPDGGPPPEHAVLFIDLTAPDPQPTKMFTPPAKVPPEDNDTVYSVSFSPDGNTIAIGFGYDLSLYDVSNKQSIAKLGASLFDNGLWNARDVRFSRDGRNMVIAWDSFRDGGGINVGNVQPPRSLGNRANSAWTTYSSAFSPDGRAVAGGESRCGLVIYCKD